MQLKDENGRELDAEFSAEPDGGHIALIMESRSGSSGLRPSRNPDYNPALELLLTRLSDLSAVLVDALVDSRLTRSLGLSDADRRVIDDPVRLAEIPDVETLRLAIGARQARVAQAPDATKGGNTTKRLRLRVEVPGFHPGDADLLARQLAAPTAAAATFILIWHPVHWSAFETEGLYEDAIQATGRGESWPFDWAVGVRKGGISAGDRAMLWRAHSDRGLVASGRITSEVWIGQHWDGSGKPAPFVDVDWDTFLDTPDRLPLEELRETVPEVSWDHLQGGGIEVTPSGAAARLARAWADHIAMLAFHSPDEPRSLSGQAFPEGALKRVEVNRYERDPRARRACLNHHGYRCAVCKLSFEERYGPLGRDYIHVHHTLELSQVPPGYHVDPVTDLVPVCPNCHAMIHRGPGPALSVAELEHLMEMRTCPA